MAQVEELPAPDGLQPMDFEDAARPSVSGRAEVLDDAFNKATAYALQEPSRGEFVASFPGMDSAMVEALYDTYLQTLALVKQHCQAEFQAICSEHQVHQQLQSMDQADVAGALSAGPPASTRPSVLPARSHHDAVTSGEGVVAEAEAAARMAALRQEAAALQDMLDRARQQESRLAEALQARQRHVSKMAESLNKVVSDVKQVYDVSKLWPGAPRLGAPAVV